MSAELRNKAEAIAGLETDSFKTLSGENLGHLLHELRTRQIELELQNEELRQAREDLALSREQYSDLYEHAPIGYLTVANNGLITIANRTVAEMLNIPKHSLQGQRFTDFIASNDQDTLYHCQQKLLSTKEKQFCEIQLQKKGGQTFWARVHVDLVQDSRKGFSILTVISNINVTRQAEILIQNAFRKLENKVEERTRQLVQANALLQDEILEHKRTACDLEELSRRQEILNLLLKLSLEDHSLEELLNLCIRHIIKFPEFDLEPSGIIFLKEKSSQNLVLTAKCNVSEELLQTCSILKVGDCLCGRAASTTEVIFSSWQDTRHEVTYQNITPHGHYCVPIMTTGQNVLGVLTLFVEEGTPRDENLEKTLIAAANVIASILQRTRVQYALANKNELISSIYTAAESVALITTDLNRDAACITSFSPGAEKIFGYSREEIIGQPIALLNIPEHKKLLSTAIRRLRTGQKLAFQDILLARKSGEYFPATVMIHPLSNGCGKNIGALGICIDISELKMIQAELEQTNEELEKRVEDRTSELQKTQQQVLHVEKLGAIGRLAASVAHEFNNPMQGIATVLNGIAKRAILEEEDMALVHSALHECTRIKKLVRSLQDFNRPSSGNKEPVNLHQAMDTLILLCKNECKKHKIQVVTDYGKNIPAVMVVPDQIKQVILNLLTNAADACVKGGIIHISTRHENDMVFIYIKDDGVGIPPENIDRIFEPFFTTKPAVKGTGLGLPISYGIIKDHKGTLDVESEPGKGSTFTISLPVSNMKDAADGA